jgi:hypothetical protein
MALPEEVAAFLRDVPAQPFCPLLTPEQAERDSAELRTRYPLSREVGLFKLTEVGEWPLYGYATLGPAAGMVLYFPFAKGTTLPTFAFPSLAAFGEALRAAAAAAASGTPLEALVHVAPTPVPDQAAVREGVSAALTQRDRDAAANSLSVLLPLLSPDDVETLGLAATAPHFLLRKVAARCMASAPHAAQVPLLRALLVDRHHEVWPDARAALAALGVEESPLAEAPGQADPGERGPTGLVISLVMRPDGKCWLVTDDLRRAGAAPPSRWDVEGHFGKDRFDLEVLLREDVDPEELASLGLSIVARLGLHYKSEGKYRE